MNFNAAQNKMMSEKNWIYMNLKLIYIKKNRKLMRQKFSDD